MDDANKTREQLIEELEALRIQVAASQQAETKRQQAEHALAEERNLLTTVLDYLPVQVYVKDLESHFVLANAATMRGLRVTTREEYLGKTDFDFMPQAPETAAEYFAEEQAVIQTGQAMLDKEHLSFTPDKAQVWTVTSKLPMRDTTGKITGIVGIGMNITERKRAEQQRLLLAVEQERAQVLTDFIRDASHEFRTPLSVIQANLYLLERAASPAKRAQQVKHLKEQVAYIGELVEAMLTMSRLDSDHRFAFESLNLNDVMSKIVARLHSPAQEKDLSLTVDLAANRPVVQGDEEAFHDALLNVVENAIRYTETGGIAVRTYIQDAYVVVEVRDTGIGIAEADLPRIFQRFYRANKARTLRGVGLGLSITQKIVEAHRGRIEVESKLGEGTTCRVYLPFEQ